MPNPSAQTAYRELVRRLALLQRKDAAIRSLTGLGLGLSCGLFALLLLLLFEAGFYLAPAAKLTLEGTLGLGLIGLLCQSCLKPLFRPPSLETLALRVERHFGGLHQRLISALQLWERRGEEGQSHDMVKAAVLQAERVTASLHFEALLDRARPLRMAGLLAGIGLFAAGAFALWPGPLSGAAGRLAHPRTVYLRPPDTRIDLTPGDAVIIAGNPFEIVADLFGVVPLQARLFVREAGVEVWTPLDLPVRQNRVTHRFGAVTRSLSYRLAANDAETEPFTLTVRPRPMVTRITRQYRYPAYTRLDARTDLEGGDIVAPAGTKVGLLINASLPLEEAWLNLGGDDRLEARVEDRTARTGLTVTGDRRYTVGLLGPYGVPNLDPVEYRIVALEDRPPEVRLIRPGPKSELDKTMHASLSVELFDDFGFSRMEVRFQIEGEAEERSLPIPLDRPDAKETTQDYLWDLSGLDLLPGDQVTCRVRAYDNNAISGPSFGESAGFTLRFPSLFEIHQEVHKTQQESLEQMEAMRETGRELRERLDEVARELLKGNGLEWQEQKEVEGALEEQTRIDERLEETVQRLNQALDRLEQNGLLAAETLQKLEEIRDLLSQIRSPELDRAMEQLREALNEVDPEAVQEALEAFQIAQEEFQQNLDRTVALLRRVQHQQTLDALNMRMETLAAEQEEIVEHLRQGDDPADLAEREGLLSRDTKRLQEEIARASEQLGPPTGEDLDRLAGEFDSRQIAERMDQVRRNLQAGQTSPAGDRGGAVARDLREMAGQLQAARTAFVSRQKAEIARELNRILHDLLALSRAQETTAQKAHQTPRGTDPAPLALEQARHLSGATRMAGRILESSKKTFFLSPRAGAALGETLRKMEDAASLLQNGDASRGSRSAQQAMGSLNTAALMVRQALANLDAAGSGVGFEEMLQQMQGLAGRQGQVNAQTKGLFNGQRPGGQTPSPQLGFGQLAAQQRAIQQALEEIRKQMAAQRQQMLGDLGNLSSEMEKAAGALQRKQVTPQTLNRQRQILSRMLDAQRSVRERGKSRKREAKQGATFTYRGPGTLPPDLGEADNPLRRRLRDALNEGYPAEYQALIRRYFESLIQDALPKGQNPH